MPLNTFFMNTEIQSEIDAKCIKVYEAVKGSKIPSRKLLVTWHLDKDGIWQPHGNADLPAAPGGWQIGSKDPKADRKQAEWLGALIIEERAKALTLEVKKPTTKKSPPKRKPAPATTESPAVPGAQAPPVGAATVPPGE